MEHYRIYPIGTDGRIATGHSVECDSDDDALAHAAELIGPYPEIEVWRGAQQVARLTAAEVARYRRT